MQIHIKGNRIDISDEIRNYIERRLGFSLGRLAARIERATVSLTDINGPQRGGEDKICRIEVRMRSTNSVIIEDVDADLTIAIDRSADRIGRSVARILRRERDAQRRIRPWERAVLLAG